MAEHKRFSFKICVVGDWAVGKTSLIQTFAHQVFMKDYKPTMGTDITIKDTFLADGTLVNFMIWDIAGQPKWEKVRKRYYSGSSAVIVVFDATRFPTYQNIEGNWVNEVRDFLKIKIPVILVANKIDLTDIRKVTTEQGKELQQKVGAFAYVEASAKTGENVGETFSRLATHLVDVGEARARS